MPSSTKISICIAGSRTTVVLEALLLTAVTTGDASALAQGRTPKPSLELLEFLGEFGDGDDELFENEGAAAGARAPVKDARPRPQHP